MKKLAILLPVFLALAFVAGFFFGRQPGQTDASVDTQSVFALKRFNKLNEVLNYVNNEYVDSVDRQELVDETIEHMLQQLDPHSFYISAAELKRVSEPLEGSFEGIGVQFSIQKDTVVVISPLSDGPSQRAGVASGDRIIKVDGEIMAGTGITNSQVMKLLKGPKGTEVKIGVYRPASEKELDFSIQRDQIPIKSVDVSYMVNDEVGYIKISRFSRKTYEEFLEGVRMLQARGMKELVIDLRNNGGGYMESAINIADELLPEGKMIVYTEGRARPKQSYYATSEGSLHDLPVAVLIDEGSASASEILAGAIQDNDRGVILGRRSFGKGLVQEQNSWPDGSATRLTIARYYTPTGRCIQKPYDDGVEAYHKDIVNRYENGELVNSDSIDFPDSLKYKTPEGKIVYGGGGIMPDIYVGLDTAGSSFLLSELYYKAIFYHFTFDYTDHHREQLESYDSPESFKANWTVSNEVLESFRAFAKERGVQYEKEQEKTSLDLIKLRIKAGIARNLFGSEGFYPIFNESDRVVNRAVEVIEVE